MGISRVIAIAKIIKNINIQYLYFFSENNNKKKLNNLLIDDLL